MSRICIVAGSRTPNGRFMGALSKFSTVDMAIAAGKSALKKIKPEEIDEVIVGNVFPAGQGTCIARQVGVRLGIPVERPAYTVNMNCASGMLAVILAAQAVKIGEANVVLCGGTESMSNIPYLLDRARGGYKLGNGILCDGLFKDGMVDTLIDEHMGLTAERLAEQYRISRQAQDEFALRSHQKCIAAQSDGKFDDEIVEFEDLPRDEHPRSDTSLKKLATLEPVFKKGGTVTAGNSSGLNDGAAMLVVCNEEHARKKGWPPLAIISGWSRIGCDPRTMGLGPVYATRKLCKQLNIALNCFDTIELNEAFAAQVLACVQELKIKCDERLNPDGGAIGLGHPVGSTGARLFVHLSHRINRGETQKGLAALCVGGGMGAAAVLEAV